MLCYVVSGCLATFCVRTYIDYRLQTPSNGLENHKSSLKTHRNYALRREASLFQGVSVSVYPSIRLSPSRSVNTSATHLMVSFGSSGCKKQCSFSHKKQIITPEHAHSWMCTCARAYVRRTVDVYFFVATVFQSIWWASID